MAVVERFLRTALKERFVILFIAIVLLGWGTYSYLTIPMQPYPGVAPLTVQVIYHWPGRSTLEMERQVTLPIGTSMAGVPGIQNLRSVDLFGLSIVTMRFTEPWDSSRDRQNVFLYLSNATLPTVMQPTQTDVQLCEKEQDLSKRRR